MERENIPKWNCPLCPRSLRTNSRVFYDHFSWQHNFTEDVSSLLVQQLNWFNLILYVSPPIPQKQKCPLCPNNNKLHRNVSQHIFDVHVEKFKCQFCFEQSPSSVKFKKHNEENHNVELQLRLCRSCPLCEESLTVGGLRQHLQKKHEMTEEVRIEISTLKDTSSKNDRLHFRALPVPAARQSFKDIQMSWLTFWAFTQVSGRVLPARPDSTPWHRLNNTEIYIKQTAALRNYESNLLLVKWYLIYRWSIQLLTPLTCQVIQIIQRILQWSFIKSQVLWVFESSSNVHPAIVSFPINKDWTFTLIRITHLL